MSKDISSKNRNILISGASIAGPALAYWLSRHGFHPTVVEQAPALREGSNAVDIRGAARDVAERMGIMPEVRQATTRTRGMSFVDSENRPQASMSADLFGGEGPISEFEILRGDLAHILYAATKDTTEYIFRDSITSLSQSDEGAASLLLGQTSPGCSPGRKAMLLGRGTVDSRDRQSATRHVYNAFFAMAILSQVLVIVVIIHSLPPESEAEKEQKRRYMEQRTRQRKEQHKTERDR